MNNIEKCSGDRFVELVLSVVVLVKRKISNFAHNFFHNFNCTAYLVVYLAYAEYTPHGNQADFGPNSPLPTTVKAPICLMILKIILPDFSVV